MYFPHYSTEMLKIKKNFRLTDSAKIFAQNAVYWLCRDRPGREKGDLRKRRCGALDRRKLIYLAPEKIVPNPAQPRVDFDSTALSQLAESIRQNGILQPILVRRDGDRYILIAGERRWRAGKLAGLKVIPSIVQANGAKAAAILALIENLQRSDLHFFEEAAAIYTLLQDKTVTQDELARRLGMSQSALANKIRLLKLSGEEQRVILENHLTERHARALLRVNDAAARMDILKKIAEHKWNVAQSEAYIEKKMAEKAQKPKRTFIAKDVRLFLNTIDRAVQAIRTAGVPAVAQNRETDDYYEYVVRIPKPNSSTR